MTVQQSFGSDSPALKLGFEPIDMSVIGYNSVSETHCFR